MPRKFLGGKPTVGTTDTPVVIETRTITATAPVTIAGTTSADLSADRTIAVSAASTSAAGVVQLSDSTSTTGSTKAATETAVKSAYDLAAAAVPKSTVTTAGDLIVATGNATVGRIAAGSTSGHVLTSNGAGAAPTYQAVSVPASTTITTPVITQGTSTPSFSSNSYTVASGDAGLLLLASNSTTAGDVKIPTNATTAFAVGTQIHLIQTGTGQLTISATTGGTTTVNSSGGTATAPKLRRQYSAATMLKTATDTWYVFGDIV